MTNPIGPLYPMDGSQLIDQPPAGLRRLTDEEWEAVKRRGQAERQRNYEWTTKVISELHPEIYTPNPLHNGPHMEPKP